MGFTGNTMTDTPHIDALANGGKIRSTDPALNNLVALPNELICQVLAFWFG